LKKVILPLQIKADTSEFLVYLDILRDTLDMIHTMGEFLNTTLEVNDLSGEEINNLQEAISEVTYKCQLIVKRRTG